MKTGRLAPGNQWDQTQLQALLPDWVEGYPNTDDPINLVVPGRYWHDRTADITKALARYERVRAFRVGDEEDLFDVSKVPAEWWVQTPSVREYPEGTRFLGVGWTPHFNNLPAEPPVKDVDLFLAGQNTHQRRRDAFHAASQVECGIKVINPTDGFTEGFPPDEYRDLMCRAKVAPCPSGPVSPDSFRVWEALEAHAVPVADALSPVQGSGYWDLVTPGAPFPTIATWAKLHKTVTPILSDWPHAGNVVTAWWMRYKGQLRDTLRGCVPVTVVVPVSPIPSHPDTTILDETVASIRHHLPDAPIVVTFDGVRSEDEPRHQDYDEHIYRALWRLDHLHGNVRPYLFDGHHHQTGMMRTVLADIQTPLVMYVEHDTPLVVDEPIDFPVIFAKLQSYESDLVRLHHEAVIPSVHDYLMHGHDGPFLRTSQWSQRPHVASAAFYRRILDTCFTEGAKSFIEDKMHGVVDEAVKRDGLAGWNQYRLHIWDPGTGNMKRTYHLDGRAGGPKYDSSQVF